MVSTMSSLPRLGLGAMDMCLDAWPLSCCPDTASCLQVPGGCRWRQRSGRQWPSSICRVEMMESIVTMGLENVVPAEVGPGGATGLPHHLYA